MKIDQIAPEAFKLPARERALLAASLWESIEDPFELAVGLDDEEAIKLAEARDRDLESGRVTAISQADLMRKLRQRGLNTTRTWRPSWLRSVATTTSDHRGSEMILWMSSSGMC